MLPEIRPGAGPLTDLVWLEDGKNVRRISAKLVALTGDFVVRAQSEWQSAFQERSRYGANDLDSLAWEQGFLAEMFEPEKHNLTGYAIVCESSPQGILVVNREPQASRFEKDRQLLYVRYLATAPWNRRLRRESGRFSGIGRLLAGMAVRVSHASGHQGRIGLHALLDADQFYRRLRFDRLGPDAAKRGMGYYELCPDAALRLVEEIAHDQAAAFET